MNNWRDLANKYRDTPLEQVLLRVGGVQDVHDRQKWRIANGTVWLGKGISSKKFFDHTSGAGGGGAIDLIQHTLKLNFKEAVTWLHTNFGTEVFSSSKAMLPKAHGVNEISFLEPCKITDNFAQVFSYLTVKRSIPAGIVNLLAARGSIYADERHNAVFLCEFNGAKTGAEIHGTNIQPFKGMAQGSRRGVGFFTVPHSNPTKLVVVESAIDALSYQALHAQETSLIVSTAGVLPACPKLGELAKMHGMTSLVIAYDSDKAGEYNGEQLANSLSNQGLSIIRRTPQKKDWNEELQCMSSLFGEFA